MYLTRMQLNGRRRDARRLLSSPHALHAAVQAGFPDARAAEAGRVLWRLDSYGPHRILLYVVGPARPDFTHLVEQAGWPTTQAWDTREYDPFIGSLRAGQRWQFRLAANPVHSARRAGWNETKPLAHVTVKQQEQWLLDRCEQHGFRPAPSAVVPDAGGQPEPDLAVVGRATHRFQRGQGRVTLATATFEGHLLITDAEALRGALCHGIGRGKAYGCGLLTLAPVAVGGER
jgi:CRISPR system Cascade subunit CasE